MNRKLSSNLTLDKLFENGVDKHCLSISTLTSNHNYNNFKLRFHLIDALISHNI